jgi:hypothetical protein
VTQTDWSYIKAPSGSYDPLQVRANLAINGNQVVKRQRFIHQQLPHDVVELKRERVLVPHRKAHELAHESQHGKRAV